MRPKCDKCNAPSDVTNFATFWLCAKCWLKKYKYNK